jgi:organic hydroperoxide reductase OsmC/OhrA
VPLPYSVAEAVDPEEAFIASLSSCHLLWFLDIACQRGYTVESYRDQATGVLAKNNEGRLAITIVTLHPEVTFAGDKLPAWAEVEAMHHQAHESCFIASSVKTEVRCVPINVASR